MTRSDTIRLSSGPSPRSSLFIVSLLLLLGLAIAGPADALSLTVQVEGLKGEAQQNVLALLGIYQERSESGLTPERLESLHRQAPEQIRNALAPFGYYRVDVKDELDKPKDPQGAWRALYRVSAGDRIKIATVDYQIRGPGSTNPAFPKEFPMHVGDVLLHSVYEKAKGDIRYAATANGYLDYELSIHEVLVDPVAYQAHIVFHLETGPQYRFGQISFKQDLLKERLLRRYVQFKKGEIYDPDKVLGLQSRLLGTEYYSDVEVVPLKDQVGPNEEVPLEVIATRNKPNKFRFGVGFATDSGPRVSMDWQRRYLNSSGHKLRTELSIAPALSTLTLDYRIPIRDPTRDYVIIKPQSSYYNTSSRKGVVHTIQAAQSTLQPGDWRRNLGLEFRYEDLEIDGEPTDASISLVPNVSWSKTVSDDPINTNKGYRIKYSILGAVEGVLSDASFLTAEMNFKWVRRFAPKYRFITRTDLGATLASSVTDLPPTRRFYAGGDSSIRGWGYDALGPNDPETDKTVGGRYLAVGSLELERELKGPWSAAIFTDFGNAFDPDYKQEIDQSVGVGLRWASPIGQVRLDVAFALTKGDDHSGGVPPARLHIVIGPDL